MLDKCLLGRPCDKKTREALIGNLLLDYGFVTRDTIGESRCSRPVDMLCIGSRKKQVLLAGAFHGMEWITSMLLLKFMDDISSALLKGEAICGIRPGYFLNLRGLAVIPCVNPDGVEIQIHGSESAGSYRSLVEEVSGGNTDRWQANAAGVDINHNFQADWEKLREKEIRCGINSPSPTRFGGEYPESEPESRTIASYCRAGNISHALALHSQGEEIYWSYGDYQDKQAHDMAQAMAKSSGYHISEPEGLAVGGGFKDWFVLKFRRPAFTIEVGTGENPLPVSSFEEIYSSIREMLVLSLML